MIKRTRFVHEYDVCNSSILCIYCFGIRPYGVGVMRFSPIPRPSLYYLIPYCVLQCVIITYTRRYPFVTKLMTKMYTGARHRVRVWFIYFYFYFFPRQRTDPVHMYRTLLLHCVRVGAKTNMLTN